MGFLIGLDLGSGMSTMYHILLGINIFINTVLLRCHLVIESLQAALIHLTPVLGDYDKTSSPKSG